MTLPRERTNALRITRDFLRALLDRKKTPRVPVAIRREAYWCLRHYPGEYDLKVLAEKAPKILGPLK